MGKLRILFIGILALNLFFGCKKKPEATDQVNINGLKESVEVIRDEAGISARKAVVTRFFLERIVPEASGLKSAATAGSDTLYTLDMERLAG